jgi:hypothetical protein
MGSTQIFNTIVLDNSTRPDHYPRGYEVYVSKDGETWGDPVSSGTGTPVLTTITFDTKIARYFRLVQTNESYEPWSIADLRVYMDLDESE